MRRRVVTFIPMLAALLATSAPVAADGFDGMPLMQFGDTLYEPLYPCTLVIQAEYRHVALYCDGPEGDGIGVLQHPGLSITGPAVATGWHVEALLPINMYGSVRFEDDGCEIVAPNDFRCDGFSDGFEP